MGITNQRETTLVWDRVTGKALHNAIVWLDTRTAALCDRLTKQLGSQVSRTREKSEKEADNVGISYLQRQMYEQQHQYLISCNPKTSSCTGVGA